MQKQFTQAWSELKSSQEQFATAQTVSSDAGANILPRAINNYLKDQNDKYEIFDENGKIKDGKHEVAANLAMSKLDEIATSANPHAKLAEFINDFRPDKDQFEKLNAGPIRNPSSSNINSEVSANLSQGEQDAKKLEGKVKTQGEINKEATMKVAEAGTEILNSALITGGTNSVEVEGPKTISDDVRANGEAALSTINLNNMMKQNNEDKEKFALEQNKYDAMEKILNNSLLLGGARAFDYVDGKLAEANEKMTNALSDGLIDMKNYIKEDLRDDLQVLGANTKEIAGNIWDKLNTSYGPAGGSGNIYTYADRETMTKDMEIFAEKFDRIGRTLTQDIIMTDAITSQNLTETTSQKALEEQKADYTQRYNEFADATINRGLKEIEAYGKAQGMDQAAIGLIKEEFVAYTGNVREETFNSQIAGIEAFADTKNDYINGGLPDKNDFVTPTSTQPKSPTSTLIKNFGGQ
jgi:hypothetical protein